MAEAMTAERLEEIVDAFNRHDIDAILAHFTDDCEWFMASGPETCGRRLVGKDAIRKVLEDRFRVIADMRWVSAGSWVNGDQGVSEWTVQGTTETGERIDWLGCDLWKFRNGLVARKDTYWKRVEGS